MNRLHLILVAAFSMLLACAPEVSARVYNAETGRFFTRDRLGQVDGPNLYQYVRSRPITMRDPTGLVAARCGSTCQGALAVITDPGGGGSPGPTPSYETCSNYADRMLEGFKHYIDPLCWDRFRQSVINCCLSQGGSCVSKALQECDEQPYDGGKICNYTPKPIIIRPESGIPPWGEIPPGECRPGDGEYGACCPAPLVFKVVNGCTLYVTASGCSVSCSDPISALGQAMEGGCRPNPFGLPFPPPLPVPTIDPPYFGGAGSHAGD
jgi:hypothetical protein